MISQPPEQTDFSKIRSSSTASNRAPMLPDAQFGIRSSAASTSSAVTVRDVTATILSSPLLTQGSRPSVHDDALVSAAAALTQLTQSSAVSLPLPTPPTSETASPTSIPPQIYVDSHAEGQSPSVTLADDANISVNNKDHDCPEPITNETLRYETQHPQHPLVNRVARATHHPLVTNAVRYYELSKRNYAPFNYAAVKIEQVAKPVVVKIEDNLNSRHQASIERKEAAGQRLAQTVAAENMNDLDTKKRKRSFVDVHDPSLAETRKRIQFCLHMLRAANDQINSKVGVLQQKMTDRHRKGQGRRVVEADKPDSSAISESARSSFSDSQDDARSHTSQGAEVHAEAAQQTKTEIITTVKKIIHLISDFRPLALSPHAVEPYDSAQVPPTRQAQRVRDLKRAIREIIFHLPFNVQQKSIGSDPSPLSIHKSATTNDRILVFAQESLDMITKLTTVFNEQLDKAENWVAGEERDHEMDNESSASREATPASDVSTLCVQPEPDAGEHHSEGCDPKRIRLNHILNEKN